MRHVIIGTLEPGSAAKAAALLADTNPSALHRYEGARALSPAPG